MHTLAFVCPNTDELVSAGIGMDERTYEHVHALTVAVQCSRCGQEHLFKLTECVVAEDDSADLLEAVAALR